MKKKRYTLADVKAASIASGRLVRDNRPSPSPAELNAWGFGIAKSSQVGTKPPQGRLK